MNIPNTIWADTTLDSPSLPLNGWPSTATQGGAGLAVCHGGHIQYALRDSDNQLTVLTSSLATYQNTHHVSDLNNWTTTRIADLFPKNMSSQFLVQNLLSLVSAGDYTYIFWCNNHSGPLNYYALRTSPDMVQPPVLARVSVANDSMHSYVGNMACFAMPDTFPDIAGKIGCVLPYEYQGYYYFQTLLLDPLQFKADSPWPVITLNNSINSNFKAPISVGFASISAGWCNQGAGLVTADGEPQATVTMVIVAGNGANCQVLYGDLLAAFSFDYNRRKFDTTGNGTRVEVTKFPNHFSASGTTSPTLCTTPDGELVAQYNYSSSNTVKFAVFVPATTSGGKPSWQSYGPTSTSALSSHNSPCCVFVPIAATTGPSPVPILPPTATTTNTTKQTYNGCLIQNYAQCIFTSSSDHVPQVATWYWGCFFTVPGYSQSAYVGPRKTVASLVADAFPYPVPSPTVWGADSPSGMVNWLLCTYEYLVGNDSGVDIDYNLRSSVGMKFESTNLVAGIGLRAEGSLSTGFSLAVSHSDSTRRATAFSVTTKGVPGSTQTTLPISPAGTLFGTPPPASIVVDLVLVLRRGDTDISPAMAMVMRPTVDDQSVATAGEYTSFLSTPGNLATYQEATIGATMQTAYTTLSAALAQQDEPETPDFTFNGEDFTSFYTSGNYVEDVVKRFGSSDFGPNGDLPYLEFSFSETGIQRSEFQATSSFRAGGSMFVDGSYYAGLAWGLATDASIGFLGIVNMKVPLADINGYAVIGAEFSTELGAAGTSGSEWGVQLGEYLNPLAAGEAYTVRMYILKPSPLWAREVQYFGQLPYPDDVDTTNSAPVRILFTVPYVSNTLSARLAAQFTKTTTTTA